MAGGHRKFRSAHPFGKKKRRPRPREILSDSPAAEVNDTASNATAPTDDAIAHVIPTAKVTRVDTPLLSDAQKAEIVSRARDTEKKLSQMSATRRKQSLLGEKTEDAETTATGTSFTVLSLAALNELLRRVKCKLCGSSVNISKGDREYGIAVKLILNCDVCGEVDTTWSSPRVDGDAKCNPFEVNVLATRAVLSTGNGQTVLNDFCAALNISKRGMHTKTYQNYVKNKLNPAARRAAAHVIGECVDAVKALYSDLDFGNPGNVAVSFDGSWLTRGHSSHISAVAEAVMRFNVGKECATEAILRELNVNVGSSSLQRCGEKDRRRLAASDKKHKQAENFRHAMKRKRTSGNEKDYVPGGF
ncbi:hypothetical protein HPB47_015350 [Ixodes persulcatus]|uniref:Uncharacterized protein n=1 Tax=Ixodes persulcatus TaxID=34615 RepID=A0AC60QTU4_IXOPE|nr:hypothetical protein HPB47_015350 [Ixodes persulcatus]